MTKKKENAMRIYNTMKINTMSEEARGQASVTLTGSKGAPITYLTFRVPVEDTVQLKIGQCVRVEVDCS